jgi:hypothetical protein
LKSAIGERKIVEEILIAPCGMNCALCGNYLSMKHDLKKKGIQKSYCAGCRPRGKNCAFMKRNCELIGEGRIKFCYECDSFPCRRLKGLDKRYRERYHMSMIENLTYISEHGMKQFLKQQEEKWQCPECGGVICCHNGICYSCSLEKLKAKKYTARWEE